MERLRELLELLRKKGIAAGNFLGLLHVLIWRRLTTTDGTLVSAGVTWRELAAVLKRVRWDPEVVREIGLDPANLPVRDRQRYWYAAIAQARVDRPEAAAREIEITAEIQKELPLVAADPVRLMQALVNLVINALQAVERKGRIQVSAGRFENSLSLQVRDNGPGIPAEKLVSIFEPYFTTKPEGTGMGLWIAQQIATAHGGSLRVQNAPERGAVFTLLLPLKQVTP